MYTAIHEWLFSSNFRAMHLNSIRITFCSIRIFGDRTERFYRGTGKKFPKVENGNVLSELHSGELLWIIWKKKK